MSRSEREAMEEFAIRSEDGNEDEAAARSEFRSLILQAAERRAAAASSLEQLVEHVAREADENTAAEDEAQARDDAYNREMEERFEAQNLQPRELSQDEVDEVLERAARARRAWSIASDEAQARHDAYNREMEERFEAQNLQPSELSQDEHDELEARARDYYASMGWFFPESDNHLDDTEVDIEGDKKKELCMDGINLLDSVMNSGECMKEVDYLKMCNIFKELYV
jgi:hypothetical protein